MSTEKNNTPAQPPFVALAFLFCVIYWTYLALISQMVLVHEAIGYESLGAMIHQQNWSEYFKTGPNREPVYPWIVSFAMQWAQWLDVSYQSALRVIQLSILGVTQLLTLYLLKKLNVKPLISACTILYIGISPALLGSSLNLFSEIATYPSILAAIIFSLTAWQNILHGSWKNTLVSSVLLAASFVAVTLTKGIFELIVPLYLILFAALAVRPLRPLQQNIRRRVILFFLTFLIAFYVPLLSYKALNKHYNGNFILTSRGGFALYGNTARRTEPLTAERILTAITYVPGPEVCAAFFGDAKCLFWSYVPSDAMGSKKFQELTDQGHSMERSGSIMTRLAMQKALEHPLQYGLLMLLEVSKMIFWESTKPGFVNYPQWLSTLYSLPLMRFGLTALLSLATLIALVYAVQLIWKKRKSIFSDDKNPADFIITMILTLIGAYWLSHSFFYVLPRYALPITPLYLVLIAFGIDRWGKRKKS